MHISDLSPGLFHAVGGAVQYTLHSDRTVHALANGFAVALGALEALEAFRGVDVAFGAPPDAGIDRPHDAAAE